MDSRRSHWIAWAAVGLVVGLALGFALGWWLWPLQYTNTTPDTLQARHRDDYILMVGATYSVDGDLAGAEARLRLLDPGDPAAPVVSLAERLASGGGGVGADESGDEGGLATDIARLAALAQALGASPSTLRPYLEDTP